MCLSSIAMPSIIASLCLISHYFCNPVPTASLVCCYASIIYPLSICSSMSSSVTASVSSVDMHIGMSTNVLIICILMFTPDISWSLFSSWLWWVANLLYIVQGQSSTKCTHFNGVCAAMMHCNHCNNIATSLLTMATKGFVVGDTIYFLSKAVVMKFFWAHTIHQVLPFQCCTAPLCWKGFY